MNISQSLFEKDDWWCEKRMWKDNGITTEVDYFCTFTGFLMSVMAIWPNLGSSCNDFIAKPPLLFYLVKASVFILGLGTCIFHGVSLRQIENVHFNKNAIDFYPLVTTLFYLVLLYLWYALKVLSDFMKSLSLIFLLVWYLLILLGIDSKTHDHYTSITDWGSIFNGLALTVPLSILAWYSLTSFSRKQALYLWLWLFLSLALWLSNNYACDSKHELAVFHALYHLTITYAMIYGACLALTIHGKWQIQSDSFWPRIMPVMCGNNYELISIFYSK